MQVDLHNFPLESPLTHCVRSNAMARCDKMGAALPKAKRAERAKRVMLLDVGGRSGLFGWVGGALRHGMQAGQASLQVGVGQCWQKNRAQSPRLWLPSSAACHRPLTSLLYCLLWLQRD